MRIISTVFVFFICTFLLGCTKGSEVNGRSMRTAHKSVSMIKDRLPTEQRIEFEVSYWTIRDSIRNKDEFLDEVGGKNAEELIAVGKEIFQQRKNSGFIKYQEYTSWDQMIAKFTQERIDQNKPKQDSMERGRENNILYDL